MFSQERLPGFRASLIRPHRGSVTFQRRSCHRGNSKATRQVLGIMFKKILNKKKEETDSSSDSEDETVPHVGRKEKKSSVASLKEKLGGGPTKKESKSSVRTFVLVIHSLFENSLMHKIRCQGCFGCKVAPC